MKLKLLSLTIAGFLMASFNAQATSNLVAVINPVPLPDLVLVPISTNKDYKTFPGSTCKPYYGSTTSYNHAFTTTFYNSGTRSARVVCPILRDNHSNTDGFTFQIAHNVPTTTYCTLYSRDRYTATIEFNTFTLPPTGDTETAVTIKRSVFDGVYGLYCYLPSKGFIKSYEIIENNATDNGN